MALLTAWQSAVAYVVECAVIFLGNLLIILAILLPKALRARKELLIIASLSLGDMMTGIGFVYSGIQRIHIYSHPEQFWGNQTSFDCAVKAPAFYFWYGAQTMCAMMLAVSVDRLTAVVAPVFYYGLTPSYVARLFAAIYLVFGPVSVVAGYAASYIKAQREGPNHTLECFGTWTAHKAYYLFHIYSQMFLSLTSCCMYGCVVVVLFLRNRNLIRMYGSAAPGGALAMIAQARRRQDKVTKLLGIVVLTTLVFFTIPYLITGSATLFGLELRGVWLKVALVSWILSGVNSVSNVLVYIVAHADIRASVARLLLCGLKCGWFPFCLFGSSSVEPSPAPGNGGSSWAARVQRY